MKQKKKFRKRNAERRKRRMRTKKEVKKNKNDKRKKQKTKNKTPFFPSATHQIGQNDPALDGHDLSEAVEGSASVFLVFAI